MPWIVTVSPRSLAAGGVEVTERATGERTIRPLADVEAWLRVPLRSLPGLEALGSRGRVPTTRVRMNDRRRAVRRQACLTTIRSMMFATSSPASTVASRRL